LVYARLLALFRRRDDEHGLGNAAELTLAVLATRPKASTSRKPRPSWSAPDLALRSRSTTGGGQRRPRSRIRRD
jgi:hypothetical protein